jgi:hypothetical protein
MILIVDGALIKPFGKRVFVIFAGIDALLAAGNSCSDLPCQ